MTTGTLRLATRGSDLALRQAAGVRDDLSTRRRDVELVEVETRGDRLDEDLITELGRTGAFVRALDERVLAGEVDTAVHSLKDMPTEMPDGLVVAAVGERAPAGDALVTREGGDLADLPRGSVVGTSSLRRKAQVLAERPDLEVRPLRGNVDTRLQKLIAPDLQAEHEARVEADADHKGDPGAREEDREYERTVEEWFDDLTEFQRRALEHELDHEYDAIVLAEAGLRRSDLFYRDEYEVERLDRATHVPAPGQGAVAVTASDPEVIETIRSAMDHEPTRVATSVERTVLAELGGGCIAPIGVNALVQGEHVSTRVRVLSGDGDTEVAATRDLPLRTYREAAAEFAASLREQGAAELIAAAERAAETETAKRAEEGEGQRGDDATRERGAEDDATEGDE
ncbi:hydroxymethylbilane synthase [Halobaculum gomorrense]|uniref:Hydroxymethylbilane synthase n=1 Tax=Halobaculum gomorrense TaxID=43928 RepID=A0A1M5QDW9_9EURY|nr:hydroxymethylbilane synthase [Halobaculum gomorrense]SHH12355.1 hydroxymethylbilane synthase [Halobaculum gomorrense]